jgi:4-amino-4-deoxy-L-arabinose transferase-like glycosyltransferase
LLALLFGLNPQLLRIHAYVLSEPLFLFFSLLSFLFFDISIESQKARPELVEGSRAKTDYWLLITGFLTGLAFLTRYSGLALLATFLLSTFLLNPSWRTRLTQTGLFLAGAIPPMLAWFIRNVLVAGNATNRTFQYHPILIKTVRQGLRNFSQFLVPFQSWQDFLFTSGLLTGLLITVALVLLIWLAVRAWRQLFYPDQQITQSPNSLTFTTNIYAFAYLGAVLFSMSFFDASTKFQHRILALLYVSWMILFVAALSALTMKYTTPATCPANYVGFAGGAWESTRENLFRGFAILAGVVSLGLSIVGFVPTVSALREAGQGYASWKWRDSVVMARLHDLPADVAIYTNTPPAVYLVTGRASRVIPTAIDPADNLPRGDYEQNLAQMREDILAGRAVLALFDTTNIEDALGVENSDSFSSGLTILEKAQGDVLYGKP